MKRPKFLTLPCAECVREGLAEEPSTPKRALATAGIAEVCKGVMRGGSESYILPTTLKVEDGTTVDLPNGGCVFVSQCVKGIGKPLVRVLSGEGARELKEEYAIPAITEYEILREIVEIDASMPR